MSVITDLSAVRAGRLAARFDPARLPRSVGDVWVGKTYRAKLTAELVGKLPPAPRGLYVVKAEGVRGLELRVTKEAKTFYVRARMGNREDGNNRAKPVRVGTLAELGRWQAVLDTASVLYGDVRTKGRDFNAERAAARIEFKRVSESPAAYWERYKGRTAAHGRGKLREATVRNYAHALPSLLGTYWQRPMDALSPDVVSELYVAAREAVGVVTARTGLRTLRAMQNYFDLPNSTGKAFKKHADARARHIEKPARMSAESAVTMAAWLVDYRAKQRVGTNKHGHADLLLLAMLTGLRDRPLRALRWDWLDLEHANVTIPAEFQKNGIGVTLPLSGKATQLLQARRAIVGNSPYVFPASRDKHKAMPKDNSFFAALPWRIGPHDGRKVFGTILGNVEGVDAVPYLAIKALLTHTDGGDVTAKHYAKATPAAMRRAANVVAAVLFPA